MRKEHHSYYPDGIAAEHNSSVGHTITNLASELGAPFGFFGRRVEKLADLSGAIREAQEAVEDGRMAISTSCWTTE